MSDFEIVLHLQLPTTNVPKNLWSLQVALRISFTSHKHLHLRFFQGSDDIIHITKQKKHLKITYKNKKFQAQKVFLQGGFNEKCGCFLGIMYPIKKS